MKPGVVLSVRGLRKSFGALTVLDCVDAELYHRDVVLLQGENGSGKTTLINLLTGILTPDSGSITLSAGAKIESFQFPQPPWRSLNPFADFSPERVAAGHVGRTWQELRLFRNLNSVENLTVAAPNQLGESVVRALFSPAAVRAEQQALNIQSAELLKELGVAQVIRNPTGTLSLGEAKRVSFARSLRADTKILILDEPLSGLDANGVRDMLGLLEAMLRAQALTLIIVEHVLNMKEMLKIASKVWTLTAGHLREDSANTVASNLSSWHSGFAQHYRPAREISDSPEIAQPISNGARLVSYRSRGLTHGTLDPILKIRNLTVARSGQVVIGRPGSEPTNLDLVRGYLHILEAPNGWGKTTLLETVAGIHEQDTGNISFENKCLNTHSIWERRRMGLAFLPSRNTVFRSLNRREHQTIFGNAALSRSDRRSAWRLSGGQQKWLGLSCVVRAPNVKLLLVDEPLNELDHDHVVNAWSSFHRFVEMGGTILMAVPRSVE